MHHARGTAAFVRACLRAFVGEGGGHLNEHGSYYGPHRSLARTDLLCVEEVGDESRPVQIRPSTDQITAQQLLLLQMLAELCGLVSILHRCSL